MRNFGSASASAMAVRKPAPPAPTMAISASMISIGSFRALRFCSYFLTILAQYRILVFVKSEIGVIRYNPCHLLSFVKLLRGSILSSVFQLHFLIILLRNCVMDSSHKGGNARFARVASRLKHIALFLASPYISLVYAVLLPGKILQLARRDLRESELAQGKK